MYKKVNINENHLKILGLFTKGFNHEFYIREVAKETKLSPRTAQLILENLEEKGILESKVRGKIKLYKLNKNNISLEYIKLTEKYKNIKFIENNHYVSSILEKVKQNIEGIGILFGSQIQNAKKESDIDILVIGSYNIKEIMQISKTYKKEIDVKCYKPERFSEIYEKDFLIGEVLDNHIVFKGTSSFLETLWKK